MLLLKTVIKHFNIYIIMKFIMRCLFFLYISFIMMPFWNVKNIILHLDYSKINMRMISLQGKVLWFLTDPCHSRARCFFHTTGRRTDKGLWETNIVVALHSLWKYVLHLENTLWNISKTCGDWIKKRIKRIVKKHWEWPVFFLFFFFFYCFNIRNVGVLLSRKLEFISIYLFVC